MTDRPTMWSEGNTDGLKRYTSQNPKFRLFMIIVGFVLILFLSIYVAMVIPSNDTALVRISSNPEAASVYINEVHKGETPVTLRLDKGPVQIKLRKEGYRTRTIEAKLANDTENISEDLAAASFPFTISTTPDGAMVYIDDEFKGLSPLHLEENYFGKHKVRASLPGYQEQERIVDFDNESQISFDMSLKLFKVSIDSDPSGANIFIDDEVSSTTPWSGQLEGGVHSIRLALEGHKMIRTEIEVTSDLENIVLPFSSKSLSIEAYHGDIPVYGSNIYVCIVKDGSLVKKIPPLLLGTTQWTGQSNLVASYLTQIQPVPEYGIVLAKNSLKGADIQKISLDNSGQLLTKNIKLKFSGQSSTKILGVQIDNNDFFTLSNENPKRLQSMDHFGKFFLNKEKNTFKNRDEPKPKDIQLDKGVQIDTEDIIISPDEEHMAFVKNGSVTTYTIKDAKMIHKSRATEAVFTKDNAYLLTLHGNTIQKTDLKNGSTASAVVNFDGKLFPITDRFVVVTKDNKKLYLWDILQMTQASWESLIGNDAVWKESFVPTSLFVRFAAGEEKVLLLGQTFGLGCAVSVTSSAVSLLNIWMPETVVTAQPH